MNYLNIYNYDEKHFDNNGLAVLNNAFDICIIKELNGDYRLTFSIPLNNDKRNFLIERNIIKADEQLFRIVQINDDTDKCITAVTCLHIWSDSKYKHIADTEEFSGSLDGDVINTNALHIMSEAFKNTKFHVLSDNELNDIGMEWENKGIDFWHMSKTTPAEITEKLLDLLGRGYLYIDNYNIAIVKKIGKSKPNGIILRKDKNIIPPKRVTATDSLITRLYPYGANDLHINSITGSYYIDSSSGINKYGVIEGYKTYNDIETPQRLLEYAQWEFSEDNYYRIDQPDVSYEFDYIELEKLGYNENLNVGDEVKIYDEELNTNEWLTVIYKEYYPLEPIKSKIKVGRPVINLGQLLKENQETTNKLNKNLNKYDEVAVKNSKSFINTIVEVTKENVLAADIIEAGSVFSEDIFTERLQTNLKNYKCIPKLIIKEGVAVWENEENHTYSCSQGGDVRGYIKMEGLSQEFIEAHLSGTDNIDNMTLTQIQPLKIEGRQVYYTSIIGGDNPYRYFTFVEPQTKYENMSDENAEMFKVYVRKTNAEYKKVVFGFDFVNGTYEPKLTFGVGDEMGNGRFYFRKDGDSGVLGYTKRGDGVELGVKLNDEGCWYYDIKDNTWKLIGSGGESYTILDHEPTQSDIVNIKDESLVIVYDVSSVYVPTS